MCTVKRVYNKLSRLIRRCELDSESTLFLDVVGLSVMACMQVIDLGVHSVPGCQEEMLLMEIAPFALASRDFPPPKSLNCYAPGYRQAPDPKAGVAIVFCQAKCVRIWAVQINRRTKFGFGVSSTTACALGSVTP